MATNLDSTLDPNETIIWRGRPRYGAYVLSFVPVTIVGLFWCSFLSMFYWAALSQRSVPFFAWLILIPHTVVGFGLLVSPLLASLAYPNIEYALTNKRVITKSGLLSQTFETVDYTELSDVSVRVGLLGQWTKTGDVRFVTGTGMQNPHTNTHTLSAIDDPYGVFKLLKQTYFDIKTDVQYPNQLRPADNPGYQTHYQPGRKSVA
jgi:PH (Pleckstrin Homology) domain-containing protein